MKNSEEKERKERNVFGVWCVVLSIGLSVLIGLILFLAGGRGSTASFYRAVVLSFFFLGAGGVASGVLILSTKKLDAGEAFVYGMSWYYGTAILSRVLFWRYDNIPTGEQLLISGLIVALVCVIIYQRRK